MDGVGRSERIVAILSDSAAPPSAFAAAASAALESDEHGLLCGPSFPGMSWEAWARSARACSSARGSALAAHLESVLLVALSCAGADAQGLSELGDDVRVLPAHAAVALPVALDICARARGPVAASAAVLAASLARAFAERLWSGGDARDAASALALAVRAATVHAVRARQLLRWTPPPPDVPAEPAAAPAVGDTAASAAAAAEDGGARTGATRSAGALRASWLSR